MLGGGGVVHNIKGSRGNFLLFPLLDDLFDDFVHDNLAVGISGLADIDTALRCRQLFAVGSEVFRLVCFASIDVGDSSGVSYHTSDYYLVYAALFRIS